MHRLRLLILPVVVFATGHLNRVITGYGIRVSHGLVGGKTQG